MRNKLLVGLILLFGLQIARAQGHQFQAPDYAAIKAQTLDSKSPNYYPLLLQRFHQSDSTLSAKDFSHLYFGYIYQSAYKPYAVLKQQEEFNQIYQTDDLKKIDQAKAMSVVESVLKQEPFNLRAINLKSYLLHLRGEEVQANQALMQFYGLFGAIVATGNGRSCDTAMHVIYSKHEYEILSFYELISLSQNTQGPCDYLEVEPGKHKVKGLYFNVEKMLEKQSKSKN